MLKKVAAGGAIAWTAPMLISGVASAAGGTVKCRPRNSSPAAAGYGFGTSTVSFTNTGSGPFTWTATINFSFTVPSGAHVACSCSSSLPVVQYQYSFTACYKSGGKNCGTSSSTTWTTLSPSSNTFSGTITISSITGKVSGATGVANGTISLRVICDNCGPRPRSWNCSAYTASASGIELPTTLSTTGATANMNFSQTTDPTSGVCDTTTDWPSCA